jgi:hypothetical protein
VDIYIIIYITIVYHRIPQLYMGISWNMIGIFNGLYLEDHPTDKVANLAYLVSPHSAGLSH